ncbi:MAG: helix-turn-helix domain-containing protein [Gammaproteobacteria bacterium]|nr:helix-turn-helix domain-containing protein [Gammaproteobacteria bacterium]
MGTANRYGRELRALRLGLGLTQARVAGIIGVSPNTVARQERGEKVPCPVVQAHSLKLLRAYRRKRNARARIIRRSSASHSRAW